MILLKIMRYQLREDMFGEYSTESTQTQVEIPVDIRPQLQEDIYESNIKQQEPKSTPFPDREMD